MTDSLNKPGIVYLVGAGPGHPGLITRLGYELLQQCDAVAYDALIPMELISSLPEGVEKYYVGKRSGKHSLPQSEISELLAVLARRGLKVVRLKGGDPFIFGRSGEEAEHLSAAGIPVVLVPGVTAASAAAAMSGFSLTNRRAASWIFLGTGHGAENSNIPVPWDQVAALSGGTLVMYMGLAKLDQVVAHLLSSGLSPETPAIATQAASTGIQRSVEAPLAALSQECRRRHLRPPALIVIGEAVRYRADMAKIGSDSLAGRTVLVTSPSQLINHICRMLRNEGSEPIPYPTVIRKPVDDVEGWGRFLKLTDSGGVCLFTGEIEVRCFFEMLFAQNLDMRGMGRFKIIALGSSTEAALLERGIKADAAVENLEPQAVARCISKLVPDASLPLVLVHGNSGESFPAAGLREQRAEVVSLTVCQDSTAAWDAHWKENLVENPPDYIAFTSAAEVEGFVELMGAETARCLASKSCVASMSTSITEALGRHGLPIEVESARFCIGALVSALASHSQERATEAAMPTGC